MHCSLRVLLVISFAESSFYSFRFIYLFLRTQSHLVLTNVMSKYFLHLKEFKIASKYTFHIADIKFSFYLAIACNFSFNSVSVSIYFMFTFFSLPESYLCKMFSEGIYFNLQLKVLFYIKFNLFLWTVTYFSISFSIFRIYVFTKSNKYITYFFSLFLF